MSNNCFIKQIILADLLKVIIELDNRCEIINLDYKRDLPKRGANCNFLQLLRDILAISNSGGGHIIFGVKDDNYEIVGVTGERNEPAIKQNDIEDYIEKYFSQTIECTLHITKYKEFDIPYLSIQKSCRPISFKRNSKCKCCEKKHFEDGEYCIRQGSKTLGGSHGINESKVYESIVCAQEKYDTHTHTHQVTAHMSEIVTRYLNSPLPIDNDLTLEQIYINSSASLEVGKKKDEEIDNLPVSLIEKIYEEKDNGSYKYPIVIIGDPGHGKTSTVLHLVNRIINDIKSAKRNVRYILFYEFKHLKDLKRHHFSILSDITPFVEKEEFFYGKNTILILDGMDERQITENSDRLFNEFINSMLNLSKKINLTPHSSLTLILTGRSQFVKHTQHIFPSKCYTYKIKDFSEKQVSEWLNKYYISKKLKKPYTMKITMDELKSKKLDELMTQPVLLTISNFLLTSDYGAREIDNIQGDKITKSQIYKIIVDWTYDKKWHSEKGNEFFITSKDYNKFLKALAYILHIKGCEDVKISFLKDLFQNENICEVFGISRLLSKYKQDTFSLLNEIAVIFFFKGLNDESFSFVHKSIKDYLFTRFITDSLTKICQNFDPDEPDLHSISHSIYFILACEIWLEDHHYFFREILESEDPKRLHQILFCLLYFFKKAIRHTYLIECASNNCLANLGCRNPIELEHNVLINSMYIANIINAILQFPEKEEVNEFYSIINRNVSFIFSSSNGNFYLPKVNLEGACLAGTCLIATYLKGANLREADLAGAILEEAILEGANLQGVNLQGANLEGANLKGADLIRADLQGANLAGAILEEVDLTGSILEGTCLAAVNFRSSVIIFASLRGANLERANLQGVNLQSTNSQGANLKRANLQGALIQGANLQGANLQGANLQGANLQGALIQGANLQGANLQGANLQGANLLGASLTEAKFDSANLQGASFPPSYNKD